MADRLTFHELGCAKLDIDRERRRGFPEAVFCQGKSPQDLLCICRALLKHRQQLLLTRLDRSTYLYLKKRLPRLRYSAVARLGFSGKRACSPGFVAVLCAGTVDIPVAEEAAMTLEVMGNRTKRFYDVGVAGVHRLMSSIDDIRKASVIVVVAGMEGALASLVSGLVKTPVVAVPTSFGYGANFQGLAALLTMLNSCSPGVTVVNIDNGFGAGYAASLINRAHVHGDNQQ